MTESADYILAKIIELNKDIDKMELFQNLAEYAIIIGVCLVAVSLIVLVLLKESSDLSDIMCWAFLIGLVALGFGAMTYVYTWFELSFTYDQMDGLVLAYETVYGPLPEGIL